MHVLIFNKTVTVTLIIVLLSNILNYLNYLKQNIFYQYILTVKPYLKKIRAVPFEKQYLK